MTALAVAGWLRKMIENPTGARSPSFGYISQYNQWWWDERAINVHPEQGSSVRLSISLYNLKHRSLEGKARTSIH
jgi:hypothetical protein